jgi:dihydrofolate reductase
VPQVSQSLAARSDRGRAEQEERCHQADPGQQREPADGASVAQEAAAALGASDKDVSIGGAGLAAAAIELGLVGELRMFRDPVIVGGGTPFLPPVTEDVRLDRSARRPD